MQLWQIDHLYAASQFDGWLFISVPTGHVPPRSGIRKAAADVWLFVFIRRTDGEIRKGLVITIIYSSRSRKVEDIERRSNAFATEDYNNHVFSSYILSPVKVNLNNCFTVLNNEEAIVYKPSIRERLPFVISAYGSLDLVDLHGVGRPGWHHGFFSHWWSSLHPCFLFFFHADRVHS